MLKKFQSDCDNIASQLHDIFSKILTCFAEHSGLKDRFSLPMYQFIISGQGVTTESEKMKSKISFGIYHSNFFMDSDFQYPWYLKSMDDDFWLNIIELKSFGKLKFQESVIPSSHEEEKIYKQMKNSKSNIFQIIRNYILLEASGGSVDLGGLEIEWPINTQWEDILHNGSEIFKRLYRINYLLYRNYYLNTAARKSAKRP